MRVYGPEHLLLVQRLNALGRVLRTAGNATIATRCFSRAAEIVKKRRSSAPA